MHSDINAWNSLRRDRELKGMEQTDNITWLYNPEEAQQVSHIDLVLIPSELTYFARSLAPRLGWWHIHSIQGLFGPINS